MGSCCTKGDINIVNLSAVERITVKTNSLNRMMTRSPLKVISRSKRSSIYEVNNENITLAYDFENQIGAGFYGTVKIAVPKNEPNKKYAVKSIDKTKLSEAKLDKLIDEIRILSSVDHPNIIKYYETYNDEHYFHIVMEYCTGGELFERVLNKKYYLEKEAAFVIYKIASAISHCHTLGIVHRDLKPENILYESMSDESDLKIIDFGLSKKFSLEFEELHSIVGSPYYVAPEVLQGNYNSKCDIWSLGVLMYVLLCGTPPFYSDNKVELYYKIGNEKPSFKSPVWNDISTDAIKLIKKLLKKDPKKRPKASKVLEFPWFNIMVEKNNYSFREIDRSILQELKEFNQPREFVRSILKYMVKELKCSDLDKLKKTFIILDKNKTGFIDISMIETAFIKNEIDIDSDELKWILSNCANGSTQKINYTRFIAAAIDKRKILKKNILWETFKHFDTDSAGFITFNSFKQALKRTGKNIKDFKVEEMFKEIGLAVDSKITFEDFSRLLKKEFD